MKEDLQQMNYIQSQWKQADASLDRTIRKQYESFVAQSFGEKLLAKLEYEKNAGQPLNKFT